MRNVAAKSKVPYFDTTVSTDVDVEIPPDELHDAGWHHESECRGLTDPAIAPPLVIGGIHYQDAIASLHRQAHPGQLADPAMCREEPCRSMDIELLITRMGRAS